MYRTWKASFAAIDATSRWELNAASRSMSKVDRT